MKIEGRLSVLCGCVVTVLADCCLLKLSEWVCSTRVAAVDCPYRLKREGRQKMATQDLNKQTYAHKEWRGELLREDSEHIALGRRSHVDSNGSHQPEHLQSNHPTAHLMVTSTHRLTQRPARKSSLLISVPMYINCKVCISMLKTTFRVSYITSEFSLVTKKRIESRSQLLSGSCQTSLTGGTISRKYRQYKTVYLHTKDKHYFCTHTHTLPGKPLEYHHA